MGNIDRENHLFEVHQVDGHEERFIGNAGIVIYPNGKRCLVIAKHVGYEGLAPRNIMVKNECGKYDFDNKNLNFKRRKQSDLAEMELPPGEGIIVADEADLSEYLKIVGTG